MKSVILAGAIGVLLLASVVGCSSMTDEYVRIMPTEGQSILQLLDQTKQLVAKWKEFSPNLNCSDKVGGFDSIYKIQADLQERSRGVIISISVDSKNGLLFLIYSYQGTRESITPEAKRLFEDLMERLKTEFSQERVIQMDLSNPDDRRLVFQRGLANLSCVRQ